MAKVDVPYIRERQNKDGSIRHYWIRPGFRVVVLPDDEDERAIKAMRLNQDAKKGLRRAMKEVRPEEDPRLFAFWITRYQETDAFKELSDSTKRSYGVACKRLTDILGMAPVEGITAMVSRRYLAEHEKTIQTRRRSRAVISNIMNLAIDEGVVPSNPIRDVKLKSAPKRREVYSDDEIAANLAGIDMEAQERRAWLRMAFMLELYTGQRIGDCLAMTWGAYDGEFIDVVQEKTGKEVSVYCHQALKLELEQAKAVRTGTHIVQRGDGRPVAYHVFRPHMKRVRGASGLGHLTNHDVRRTAATKLAEAGNSISVIAAVTGHSENSIQTLCEVYIQKTRRMTKAAITKLEQFQKGKM